MFACGAASGRWLGVVVLGGSKSETSTRARVVLRAPLTLNNTVADMCQCSNAEHQAFLRLLIAEHLPVSAQLGFSEATSQPLQYCSSAAAKAFALLFCSADDTVMSWLSRFNAATCGPYTVRVPLTVPIPNLSLPAFEFVTSQSTFKFWALFSLPSQSPHPLRISLVLNSAAEHTASLDSAWLASQVLPHDSPQDTLFSALTQPSSSSSSRLLPISFPASTAAEFLGSVSASLSSLRNLSKHDFNLKFEKVFK